MRPALQRLLSRPSSTYLLRCLIGIPQFEARQHTTALASNGQSHRQVSIRKVAVSTKQQQLEDEKEQPSTDLYPLVKAPSNNSTSSDLQTLRHFLPDNEDPLEAQDYENWGRLLGSRLHSESELSGPAGSNMKLLLDSHDGKDGRLWARLLSYRQRIHGDTGVLDFWKGVRAWKLWIPSQGRYARFCWQTFVKLAVKDERMLWDFCEYANAMVDSTGQRWPSLYSSIILHLLRDGQRTLANRFHDLLISRHAPSSREFGRLCRQVVIWKGDLQGLRSIYLGNGHRNIYGKIVPPLCTQEDFQSALDWHNFLLKHKDLPTDTDAVEPLLRFLNIYDASRAAELIARLRSQGVPLGSRVTEIQKDALPLTREMMNVIHGKTFNISVKNYNDDLGARWFATKWISLDLAINAIHSLGIQEIGPLSLQAIALREPDPANIVSRLDQLKALGIGLGSSLYSRAVGRFARNQQYSLLDALLRSDQHPSEYDNRKLQETLMSSYETVNDWDKYKLTLAILQIDSKSPDIEKENLILRSLIANGHMPSILDRLSKMQEEGAVITRRTITHLTRTILQPRRSGTLPSKLPGKQIDLRRAVRVLTSLMKTGTYVPPTTWREIIRRLGMLWPFHYLEEMCFFLASWYGHRNSSLKLDSPAPVYRVPEQLPPDHQLHPLRLLFPDSLQRAIVEWGFIHALSSLPKADPRSNALALRPIPQITAGIAVLKALQAKGVYINLSVINRAVYNRLLIYYGPGSSQRAYNRHARANNHLTIEEMARQVDDALGQDVFTNLDLRRTIEERAARRDRKVERRKQRLAEKAAGQRSGF